MARTATVVRVRRRTRVRASGPTLLSRSSSRSYVSVEFAGTNAYGAPTATLPNPCGRSRGRSRRTLLLVRQVWQ